MKYSKYSAIIIGSGISGLYAAIKLSEQMSLPEGLLIITKSNLSESNSRYAQGGIVGVMPENKLDSVSLHVSDTIKSGAGLSDFNVVKFISENSSIVINDLLTCGVEFDKNTEDDFKFTLEGAHSVKRILHSGGDATGANIEKALVKRVRENKNITIYEETLAVELLVNSQNEVRGLVCFNENLNEYEVVYSSATILASGGLGQVYKYTTNPNIATGDGFALSYMAGAQLSDMEFVQFHPTAFYSDEEGTRFLISEAVRGEGAKLVDADGRDFMKDYSEMGDLAPRDIVTRAIFSEMKKNATNNVYLDATHIDKSSFQARFPNIYEFCLSKGIDVSKDYIPVAPACHYLMGGVKTNIINGKTSLNGLYSIGEVSCTGLHGANRLASNSLLECVVGAYELANYLTFANLEISEVIDNKILATVKKYTAETQYREIDADGIKDELQNIMWKYVGVERTGQDLEKALDSLRKLKAEAALYEKCFTIKEYELRNLLFVAEIITLAALNRQESRGGHYRADFPSPNDEAQHSILIKGEKVDELVFAK